MRLCIVASNFSESVPVPGRTRTKPRIALVWTQFLPYHIDRAAALAARLNGKAEIVAIEVASSSREYADFSADNKPDTLASQTLFPGRVFDSLSAWQRLFALFRVTRNCQVACIGIPHSNLEVVALAWWFRLTGRRAVLMIDTKFDDRARSAWFEWIKRLGLSGFSAAIVAGSRSADYLRFLGFRRRPVLGGCDTISVNRLIGGAQTGSQICAVEEAKRPFLFVGRFVERKNLDLLLDSFAAFAARAPGSNCKLVLIGSGPLEGALRDQARALAIEDRVEFAGFQTESQLATSIASCRALVLPSSREPWGLVVNEALALGIPVIVSNSPGARDLLVRNLINGFVIENGSVEGFAEAMLWLDRDEELWQRMAAAALDRASLGDVSHFADAIEVLLDPSTEPAATRVAQHLAEIDRFRGYPG